MTNTPSANSSSASSIPADDPGRALTVADPDGADVPHISVAGGTYTVLVSGAQTAGRYCLVDMLVPAGGGPRRTATTSRRCSRCSKANLNSRFAVSPIP
ncbi:hypothetical protein [Bradyrhizobium sp. 35]|uniref:hypothetical protein n=1 Tax=Bradyrhizobium sp. 35 TaxID=2782670 RepID=UPI001FF937C8|nr:hypothetical protein [Bradyrhizobium sp. 35]